MRQLTQKQADTLRGYRRKFDAATAYVHELDLASADWCDHEDYERGCPVCHLQKLLAAAKHQLDLAAATVDMFLERGPAPKDPT